MATGAVISGSTALAVLFGGEFVPQDLDIYVNDRGMARILIFLMNHGYQIVMPQPGHALKKKYPVLRFRLFLLSFVFVIFLLSFILDFSYLSELGLSLLSLVDNHYADKTLVYKVAKYT